MKRTVVFSGTANASTPVRALIAAIVERALDDLELEGGFRERALLWLNKAEAQDRPGSFQWCCEALGVNPDAVRRAFRQRLASAQGR
ncbi:MAG: hypothetical protein ACHQ9S_06720 [Candidatus Binatia bacterium]